MKTRNPVRRVGTHLGLVRHHHNLNDERIVLARAVGGARVAFAPDAPLSEEDRARLVAGIGGTEVGADEDPAVVVVADAQQAAELAAAPEGRWVVDVASFRGMVGAHLEATQPAALGVAREKAHRDFLANLPLLRRTRRTAPPAAAPEKGRGPERAKPGAGMRSTADRNAGTRVSPEDRAVEMMVRDLDNVIRSLRADDPHCRLLRR